MELLFVLIISFYILASASSIVYLINQEKKIFHSFLIFTLSGFFFHTFFLILGYIRLGTFPVLDFRSSLSFLSWSLLFVYLVFFLKFRLRILGTFVVPLSAFLVLISSVFPSSKVPIRPIFKTVWLILHVGTSFIGNALFLIAFISASLYLVQEYYIKHKKLSFFYKRLPSLGSLDMINHYSLLYGFPFLTAGIITGSIYAQYAFGKYWQWDPKETWSLITWILYAFLIHERLAVGWKGRKAAIMSILCFLLLGLSFIGTNYWIKGYHNLNNLGAYGS